MKKSISFLLVFGVLLSAFMFAIPTLAEDEQEELIYFLDEFGNATVSCNSEKENITIPSYYQGHPVTVLGSGFNFDPNLVSITLPPTITEISSGAFERSEKLTTVNFSTGLKKIGSSAFSQCTSLTSINIPSGVETIEYNAFYECTALKNVSIPDSVKTIGGYAFYACSSLSSLSLGSGISMIERGCFQNCTSLKSVTLPESVITLDICSFDGCTSLENIKFSNNLDAIKDFAFKDCKSLKNFVLPDKLTMILPGAFMGCSSITSLDIPKSVVLIYDHAFFKCSMLSSVTLHEGVEEILTGAFCDCPKMTEIRLPESVRSIGASYGLCNDETTVVDGFTVYAYDGSGAKYDAENYRFNYVNLSEPKNLSERFNELEAMTIEQLYYEVPVIRAEYDALSEAQKEYVTSYDNLLAAEKKITDNPEIPPEITQSNPGDIDGNNSVDVIDALMVLKNAVSKIELTDLQIKAADVNYDGNVNAEDSLLMLQYSVKLIKSF